MNDDIAYYEVKQKGYNETTQEPREVLLKDVPKMVNQFEKKNKITFYENTNKTTGKKTQRFNINEYFKNILVVYYNLAIQFKILALDIFKILSLPETDRGIDGLVYLNEVYEKYITLVGSSAQLNPMNKYDKLLVIDPKLLISGGSSIHSNDFNEEDV